MCEKHKHLTSHLNGLDLIHIISSNEHTNINQFYINLQGYSSSNSSKNVHLENVFLYIYYIIYIQFHYRLYYVLYTKSL